VLLYETPPKLSNSHFLILALSSRGVGCSGGFGRWLHDKKRAMNFKIMLELPQPPDDEVVGLRSSG
jgi:hypothetical protein